MYKASTQNRYLERVIWLLAGAVSMIGLLGYYYSSPWFLLLNVVVSINLIIFSVTGYCVMATLLVKLGVKSSCK